MILPSTFKVWLNCESTDMRKAINGLSFLVLEKFKNNPQNGDLFIFYNRKRILIKILYWHYNGFCLLQKRLEKSSFKIPMNLDDSITITEKQFFRLIEGLHFVNQSKEKYDVFY
jgi:transposase